MKLFYHPIYSQLALPAHHRFPISKYQRLYDKVCANDELSAYLETCCAPPASLEQINLVHEPIYVQQFLDGCLESKAQKRIGFPYSEELVKRTLQSVGNTIGAAKEALSSGFAINLGGGYHHAFADYGSGYCIFNDAAIAARCLVNEQRVDKVLIVDLDVHQGDGSAAILAHDEDIITLSVHAEQNFPRLKQHSDYDFALQKGCGDEHYLETLAQALNLVIRLHTPDLIIYNAGADVVHEDELGVLSLTLEGVLARDKMVMNSALQHHIPLACVLGGGYQRNVNGVIEAHWQLLRAAHQCYGEK
ncbi:histone deacetylase family protein [Pseudoalteromonas pernae]|uniref:histone deacetylase family protein n=1 Tax=Pseudoalteromonas pernae TaxID=3118054 RepID=UPI003242096F